METIDKNYYEKMRKVSNNLFIAAGDLLNHSKEQYLVHNCICFGTQPRFYSKLLFDEYPYADIYKVRLLKHSRPGTILIRGDGITKRYIVNLFGNYYPGFPSNFTQDTEFNRLSWFESALQEVYKIKDIKSVAMPYRIGAHPHEGGN